MPRELNADERRSYAALQQVISYAERCIADISKTGHVDVPSTKCLVPEDVIDGLKDYIEELRHTQECILGRAGEDDDETARLDAVRYEQDMVRGCDDTQNDCGGIS